MIIMIDKYEVWEIDYKAIQPYASRNKRYLKLDKVLSPWWRKAVEYTLRYHSAPEGSAYWQTLIWRERPLNYEDLEKIYTIFQIPPMKPITKEDIV